MPQNVPQVIRDVPQVIQDVIIIILHAQLHAFSSLPFPFPTQRVVN